MYTSELYHHGIIGQKWGVRRYQNKDGSYTKKGLARYKKAEDKYADTKQKYKEGKATKEELKGARKEMNKQYKQLKLDYRADQGKQLYKSGKTISDIESARNTAMSVIGLGSGVATAWLRNNPRTFNTPLGEMDASVAVLGAGLLAEMGIGITAHSAEKKLRAYYAH